MFSCNLHATDQRSPFVAGNISPGIHLTGQVEKMHNTNHYIALNVYLLTGFNFLLQSIPELFHTMPF